MKKSIVLLLVFIIVPYMLCLVFSVFNDQMRIGQGGNDMEDHLLGKEVLIEINGLYKRIDVEEYILGVLPGTISADYDMEALKVQAILIRTNVLKEMEEKGTSDCADLSYEYLTVEERIDLFGKRNYEACEERFETAVVDTAGKVLRQEGSLIMALYHEVSIGATASAQEVLGEEIAYLQSVDSSQDVEAKHYMNIVNYTWEELQDTLQSEVQESDLAETSEQIENTKIESEGEQRTEETKEVEKDAQNQKGAEIVPAEIVIEESTENGYVKKVSANGTIYTGEEFMEKLHLSSTNFYVEEIEEGLRFVCLGKGGGLGVSQYGANWMALNGAQTDEIINHYYANVSIEKYR